MRQSGAKAGARPVTCRLREYDLASLIDDTPEGANTPEFSVSELSGAVKRVVKTVLDDVRVTDDLVVTISPTGAQADASNAPVLAGIELERQDRVAARPLP